jgi:hypothetical protein
MINYRDKRDGVIALSCRLAIHGADNEMALDKCESFALSYHLLRAGALPGCWQVNLPWDVPHIS